MSCKENDTRQVAKRLFPKEKWKRYCKGVYVAKSRTPLEKELQMALILAKHAHTVYMLPEPKNVAGKHPDAIMDGKEIEFKDITGNRTTLGNRYRKALRQADNVFIRTSDISSRDAYKKIIGTVKEMLTCGKKLNENASLYLWTESESTLLHWKVKNIVADATEDTTKNK